MSYSNHIFSKHFSVSFAYIIYIIYTLKSDYVYHLSYAMNANWYFNLRSESSDFPIKLEEEEGNIRD